MFYSLWWFFSGCG